MTQHRVDASRNGAHESIDQYRAGLKAGTAARLAVGGGGSRTGCCLTALLLLPILLTLALLRRGRQPEPVNGGAR